jgi:hypothetical protein
MSRKCFQIIFGDFRHFRGFFLHGTFFNTTWPPPTPRVRGATNPLESCVGKCDHDLNLKNSENHPKNRPKMPHNLLKHFLTLFYHGFTRFFMFFGDLGVIFIFFQILRFFGFFFRFFSGFFQVFSKTNEKHHPCPL